MLSEERKEIEADLETDKKLYPHKYKEEISDEEDIVSEDEEEVEQPRNDAKISAYSGVDKKKAVLAEQRKTRA